MNTQRFIQARLAGVIYGMANASMFIARIFVAVGKMVRSLRRDSVTSKRGKKGGPDDGTQGAGVTARVKPPPPVLSAAAAKALPEPGEYESV